MPHDKPARRRGGSKARRASRRAAAQPVLRERETSPDAGRGRLLVIACGALSGEIMMAAKALGADCMDVRCLPAKWHNTPQHIAEGLRRQIGRGREMGYERMFVAYGDCGSGGAIDAVLAEEGVERLPGPHCYAFFSGVERFMANIGADARSFFLTDYLARHFDTLIWRGMMLDEHPELVEDYFGNYDKLVYLAQTEDEELTARAREAAKRLGLAFERRFTGLGDLQTALAEQVARVRGKG